MKHCILHSKVLLLALRHQLLRLPCIAKIAWYVSGLTNVALTDLVLAATALLGARKTSSLLLPLPLSWF